jgi:flagellin-like hook-associated protein FlgL
MDFLLAGTLSSFVDGVSMPGDCPTSLHLLLLVCGKHSAPSRTPFRRATNTVRLPTGIGVHLQTGMLFGITTEWCSASERNRVHLRPDSPDGPAGDVFQSVQDLITALQTNSDIAGAVNEVSDASSYISDQRVFYGNAMNQTNSQSTYLNSEATGLAQQQSNVAAADISTVATQFSADQTAESAAFSAIGSISQTGSLFDYLK